MSLCDTACHVEYFVANLSGWDMKYRHQGHEKTWLWQNPVKLPWFFVESMAISTAVSGVVVLPATQNIGNFRPACFPQAQWPSLAAQKARAAAFAQAAYSLVRKIGLG